jgi:hypothetical protein
MRSIRLASWRVTLGLFATWVIGGGCNGTTTRRDGGATADTSGVPTRPAAAPALGDGCPRDTVPTTPAELKACVDSLPFDTDTLAGDEQPLAVIGGPTGLPCPGDPTRRCRYGPLAKIEPLIGAQNYSEDDLKQGRFIARLSIARGEKEGYKKYGLQPGRMTYWWVKTDATGRGGQSAFVTETADGKVVPVFYKLKREPSEEGRPTRALARWIWTLEDETAKGNCGASKC